MEFETRKNDYIILKFNRKRTVPITIFQDVDNNPDRLFIASTLRQEPVWDLAGDQTVAQAARIEFFKRMRP